MNGFNLITRKQFSTYRNLKKAFAKTSINPHAIELKPPTSFNPKSLILFSTPTQLLNVIEKSIDLYQKDDLQLFVAGVDSVVPNSEKNGISELWLDEYIKITHSVLLDEKDAKNKTPRSRDGINIVTAKENWKKIESSFEISLNKTNKINTTLANTVFQTDNLVTLFYFQPSTLSEGQENSGQTLCDLSVSLPETSISFGKTTSSDSWTPLYDENSEPLIISKCTGNLVKGINKKPASKYLEDNTKLMSLASKDTQVFIKLYKKGQTSNLPQKFEVIAGGGGWGAKADMLAISPEAKPEIGDIVEFFMLTPQDRFNKEATKVLYDSINNTFQFDCAFEDVSYEDSISGKTKEVENVFGCGSESGFKYNDTNYKSAGEKVSISLSTEK